ncbi:right-handed parallel beta-helix repeat-containing protein [Brevibacillus daliensis]|uniref:right-handed parallel beta-helix repeat-containing protein n=1 Tax=Brevibacillus daliensis TaxID=2892995 RepID=UPI001E54CA45|nr:NosD domain-containing protein [Brevibacillus daliensis]
MNKKLRLGKRLGRVWGIRFGLILFIGGIIISSPFLQETVHANDGTKSRAAKDILVQNQEPVIPASEIQKLIDQAEEGSHLQLKSGVYRGSLKISKTIQLSGGNQVILQSEGDTPLLTLTGDGIQVEGIQFLDNRTNVETATIQVTGKQNSLRNLTIHTFGTGIALRQSTNNHIVDTQVLGRQTEKPVAGAINEERTPGKKGNGIDLFESSNNQVAGNLVTNMFDGIYVENSHNNMLTKNEITDSRYGIHIMFSENNQLMHNKGDRNVTGAMLMGSDGSIVADNRFTKQTENVNSQGILLYDVQRTQILRNHVEGNRVGLYVETSEKNYFTENQVLQNFIGLQLIESKNNNWEHNQFIGNVSPAQAKDSADNQMSYNYWDTAQVVDVDGDGTSDITYPINPFFIEVTDQVEAFQIFFQSPGMALLESMFEDHEGTFLRDTSPVAQPNDLTQSESNSQVWIVFGISLIFLAVSTSIIYIMGVRRK